MEIDVLLLLRRILVTVGITMLYCLAWMELEKAIDGEVTNRLVDNIIMVLFIPLIYIATGRFVK